MGRGTQLETTELYLDVQYYSPNRQHPRLPGLDQDKPSDRERIERVFIPRLCAGVLMLDLVRAWRRGQGPKSWQHAVDNPANRWLFEFEGAFREGGVRLPDTDSVTFEFDEVTLRVEPVGAVTGEGSWYEWVKVRVTWIWKKKFVQNVSANVVAALIVGSLMGGPNPPPPPQQPPAVCSVQLQASQDRFMEGRYAAQQLVTGWPAKIYWGQQDDRIKLVQTQLNRLRPASAGPTDVDGVWGPETERLARAVFSTASQDLHKALQIAGYGSNTGPHRAMDVITNPLVAERLLLDSWFCGTFRY